MFVSPGPAVTVDIPGLSESLVIASAANTAVASCRTSTTRIPKLFAPISIGEI